MFRALAFATALFLVPTVVSAAPPASSCSISPNPLQVQLPRTGFYVTASVPKNAVVYLRIGDSQSWTNIPNTKGEIEGAFVTEGFTLSGMYTAHIIDYRRGDQDNIIASCSFEVVL